MTRLKFTIARIVPPIAWAILIYSLSAVPGTKPLLPSFLPEGSDKIAHACEYAIFGFLIFRAGRDLWISRPSRFWMLAAFLLAVAYAATDEWHQYYVPERSCDFHDWIADAIGVSAGIAACIFVHKRWLKLGS